MPTTYTDQAYPVDAFNLATPQALVVGSITLIDQDDDGLIEPGDTLNGTNITAVYNGDTITVGGNVIQGATIYLSGGGRQFVALDGSVLQDGTATNSTWVFNSTSFNVGNLGPPCFTPGTRIRAQNGDVPVEELAVGDLVMTRDNGLQAIRWIGRKTVAGRGQYAPILIRKGTLGNRRDLRVSPQHRMLLVGWRAEMLFGDAEVLAAAKHLIDGTSIVADPVDAVEYIHIMFDAHQIVYAEDASTESFHPGDQIMSTDPAMRRELFDLFPDLENVESRAGFVTSRPVLRGFEARLLASQRRS